MDERDEKNLTLTEDQEKSKSIKIRDVVNVRIKTFAIEE